MKKNKAHIQTSASEEETIRIAAEFAKTLKPGDVVLLRGNLGSGKTTFMKGLAKGLGLKDTGQVTSPTFALMNIYPARVPVYHFDLYRLDTPREVEDIGFDDFASDGTAVTCVEWPDKAGPLLPKNAIPIKLEITGEHSRRITFEA